MERGPIPAHNYQLTRFIGSNSPDSYVLGDDVGRKLCGSSSNLEEFKPSQELI